MTTPAPTPPSPQSSTESSTEFDPAVGHPDRTQILGISCLSLVIVVIAVSSLNVAIPSLIRDLKPSPTQLLWIVDSYALVFAGFLLIAGAIGDRFGRKGALLGGLTVFGVASVVASLVDDPNLLIGIRAIMGLGAAFVMPATLSIVTSVFAPQDRPKAIATWAGFAGAGGALGPLLGGLTVEHFGWSAVFLVNVPFVVVAISLISWKVPSSRDAQGHPLDLVGALLSVAALGTLLFGVIEGPEKGWASPVVLIAFGLALVFGALFVGWELRRDSPMLDPRYFRLAGFRSGSAVISALFFGMFGMFFLLTQYLQFVKGYSALRAGVATLPSAITMILVTPRSPLIVGRFGVRATTLTGMIFGATGFAWFSTLGPDSPYLAVAFGLVLVASGMGLAMAPASTAIVSSLPQNKAGVASAVNDVTREVGGALGIAVLGSIVTSRYGSEMSAAVPAGVPSDISNAVKSSINAAFETAKFLPPEIADSIRGSARASFADAMNLAFLTSSALLAVTAALVARSLPTAKPAGEAADVVTFEASR